MDKKTKEKVSILSLMRRYLFAGIAAIFPVFVTLYAIIIIFKFVNNLMGKYVDQFFLRFLGYTIPGLGFVITLLIIIIIGIFSSHFLGRSITSFFERLIFKIPFVPHIYPAAKQLSLFLFGDKDDRQKKFKKVVLIEYPSPGSFSVGFVTNEHFEEANQKTGKQVLTILVPIPPSPFTGPILIVPPEKVIFLNMSIDQAIKFIVSGGIVGPDSPLPR